MFTKPTKIRYQWHCLHVVMVVVVVVLVGEVVVMGDACGEVVAVVQ